VIQDLGVVGRSQAMTEGIIGPLKALKIVVVLNNSYFVKGCQECELHAEIQHFPASELHSILKPWPIRGWTLDVIGEIKPGSLGRH